MSLVASNHMENGEVQTSLCQKCSKVRPPRAHHCKVCGCCVMLMDHHCPWINNCVGYFNRRYFVVFLFWGFFGLLTFVIVMLIHISAIFTGLPQLPPNRESPFATWLVVVSAIYGFGIAGGVLTLAIMNVVLIQNGETAIEHEQNKRLIKYAKEHNNVFHNQFNLGWKENFRDVFGDRHWLFWLLPFKAPPLGDGIHYKTVPYVPKR